ncbi:MAG: helix-turn-helix transcriptional regulator [Desulfovibrio sp.]|nr:helix-turn-helix transcriptional regulator [Desulfovibrio sp.]
MPAADAKKYNCPVEAALSQISGKYKAIIIYHLLRDGVKRYSELRRSIPRATAKMLSQQLRELEADGLVHREVYPVVPPRTEYSLTERGRTLAPLMEEICRWGRTYMAGTF